MKNGLSIVIRNEEQFEKASKFIGDKYCYVKWQVTFCYYTMFRIGFPNVSVKK